MRIFGWVLAVLATGALLFIAFELHSSSSPLASPQVARKDAVQKAATNDDTDAAVSQYFDTTDAVFFPAMKVWADDKNDPSVITVEQSRVVAKTFKDSIDKVKGFKVPPRCATAHKALLQWLTNCEKMMDDSAAALEIRRKAGKPGFAGENGVLSKDAGLYSEATKAMELYTDESKRLQKLTK